MDDAVGKALGILQLLAESDEAVRVSDVAAALGVAVSTAHRTLNQLRERGFVEQDPASRRYRLGPAVDGLRRLANPHGYLVEVAHPSLVQLSSEVNETVNLVVLDGPDACFVDGVEGNEALRIATRTGALLPAYSAAGGKVLLAALDRGALARLYPDGLERVTPQTLADLPSLEAELASVRRLGYALNLGEHLAEVHALAVPVRRGECRDAVAAVTVAAPATRWDRCRLVRIVPRLQTIARQIARRL